MNLEVGDKVKVKYNMLVYSTYYEWINKYIKGKNLKTKWGAGKPIEGKELKDTYIILRKGKHLDFGIMLCYIQNNRTKNCYIIDEKGIELVRSDNMVDKMFKEIYEMVEKGELKISNKMLSKKNGEMTFTIDFISNKKEILDKEEKKYLSNVIRPFRDKIKYIVKGTFQDKEYIKFIVKNDCITYLPNFVEGTMYKGMKNWKNYTLEELGL